MRGHRAAARDYLIDLLDDTDSFASIAHLQESRLEAGDKKWGDTMMWRYDRWRLEQEIKEELADALNYAAVLLTQLTEGDRG